jgi:hypothetical protein
VTLTPLFLAASLAEIDAVEGLLDAEGIEYHVRPDAVVKRPGGVCLQGLLFEVEGEQLERCRDLIASQGLSHGIV